MGAARFAGVRKRDGSVAPFDAGRIIHAISRAMVAAGEGDPNRDPRRVKDRAIRRLRTAPAGRRPKALLPSVEEIQDAVEEALILLDFPRTAKAYILYRQKRAEIRDQKRLVPDRVRRLVAENKRHFRNPLAEFIYYRTYARFLEDEGRRETWEETVGRYMAFMRENLGRALHDSEHDEIRSAILRQEVMPSMRLLWSAGPAARATNATAYNCAYVAPVRAEDLGEIMYLLMCGTGVGFSVEARIVERWPIVSRPSGEMLARHVIADDKEGWSRAFVRGVKAWCSGKDITFDDSRVRPAGSRLRTMGGRSSGPGPLRSLMEFTRKIILSRQGRRLSSVDLYDIICKIGEITVAGGVRRSALISLSDLDDREMRAAKTGHFFLSEPQRAMANNSVAYDAKPSAADFMEEWLALARGGTGERGIFNRGSLPARLPARRSKPFMPHLALSGTNPCGEINLRSKQFCNLTEAVARTEDTVESLLDKIRIATILGTYQAMLTRFTYLTPDWQRNCEEERLLGVSITGQFDSAVVRDPGVLARLRAHALAVNRTYARRFGIRAATAVTCVKPSGTVSQLVDASSGMHPRHSPHYIRRVRVSSADPLLRLLRDQKMPLVPEAGQDESTATTFVLEFPVKAPPGAVFRRDRGAIEQLEYWRLVKESYTEHNPSVTIYVGENEWIGVAGWLYEHWEILGGLSFLPRDEHVYPLAPFEEIPRERYEALASRLPQIDYSELVLHEREDQTFGAKEPACEGAVCEVG